MNHTCNVDTQEISKFSALASDWWQLDGPCAPLHALNPARLKFILQHSNLQNKVVLDIGCGAGILTESLAQHGAVLTGIDASTEIIAAAEQHATMQQLSINYAVDTAESFAVKHAAQFDIITCMELIEHVPDPQQLIQDCYQLLKPGGQLFLSTLNRTPKSYAFAIIGAEYIMNVLPKHTHDYKKFIKPSELAELLRKAQFSLQDLSGINYNAFSKSATLCQDVNVNYLAYAIKEI